MHPSEYEQYISLKLPQSHSSTSSAHANLDIQQPIVSTIKSKILGISFHSIFFIIKFAIIFFHSGEEMEFVEVNQDEFPDNTWDSFESSDFFDNLDMPHANTESAATSTTKTMELQPNKGMQPLFISIQGQNENEPILNNNI